MKDQLKRILKLVRKTGDTMIVTDSDGENAYVVMNLDQYENLLDAQDDFSSEIEDFDDIMGEPVDPVWTNAGPSKITEIIEPTLDIWNTMKPAGELGETWDLSKMSEDEVVDLEKQYEKYAQEALVTQESLLVPEKKAEENSPKLAEKDDDFGEEQFYLEPIE